jgi:copper type II ascorbate-dependent monooxygenase-like protein
MRTSLIAITALLTIGACGSNGGQTPPGDDDQPDAGGITPPARGFVITSPDIEIAAGQEITYCFYFRTPNTEKLAVKRWISEMTPGSHHMIFFTTGTQDAGPVNGYDTNCGGQAPVWTYAAQTPSADLKLPADDGTGKPLGQDVAPNTAGYFQMHYLNATDAPIKVHVQLAAEAHEANVQYTPTAAYVTFNGSINIPPQSTNVMATNTCTTPTGAKFWMMSTHAHKQAIHTEVKDAATMVMQSDDWEHPIPAKFDAPTFYEFASNKLTYTCIYNNPSNRTIKTGNSAATDEMCMASGYFFPAAGPKFCYNNILIN